MKEKTIIRSPYAFDMHKYILMTEEERNKLYSNRVDQLRQPYTVIDVLQKIYHRDFRDDLTEYVSKHPIEFHSSLKSSTDEWVMSECKLKSFKVISVESVFGQPIDEFIVDIYCEAEFRITDTDEEGFGFRTIYPAKKKLRLRYCFNFIPCKLIGEFIGVIFDENKGIYSIYPDSFHLDKYLLPVLKTQSDYERMARLIIEVDMPEHLDSDKWIFGVEWIQKMGLGVYYGKFPEQGVMGEYFLGFGTAKVYDPDSSRFKEERINPGTILLNKEIFGMRGRLNATATHEGIHHRLGYYYFVLQMCRGGCYSSYLCKRSSYSEHERIIKWTPVDILELHANKLPAYILIQNKPGRAKAKELYDSYKEYDPFEKAIRLVNDMAEHFGVTKTIARSRLLEFGYREVGNISRYHNRQKIPSYVPSQGEKLTYTIDEQEAVREYLSNDRFRKLIDTGYYTYVEGHYCVDDKRFIAYDHCGYRHLSEYAKNHKDECCLVFEIKYENIFSAIAGGVLRKTASSRKVVRFTDRNGESLVTEEGLARRKMIEKELLETQTYQKSFNQMTKELMKSNGFTIERLADETGLSVETVKNMRTEPGIRFNIEAVVSVCIAMHLSRNISEIYIDKSPAKFLDTVEMRLYKFALIHWYDNTVPEVNRKLIESGVKPLTNLISGLDDDIVRVSS